MFFYRTLLDWLDQQPEFTAWHAELEQQLPARMAVSRWGDLPQWQAALEQLPAIQPSTIDLANGVTIGAATDITATQSSRLREQLMALHPWRKGPLQFFDTLIDTEWRSDWKWDRVRPHLPNLSEQLVLDVGCGNGYHCLRMAGAGARRVIGIDPSVKFVYQFYAAKQYLGELPVDVLPLGIEQMPPDLRAFDTVFSMGVLYHRRSPMDHLKELQGLLRPGGTLVLETLVIEGEANQVLVPEGRYAKMPNVWFIPSTETLLGWMRKNHFCNPRLVDLCPTTTEEQRATDWMRFESLTDFLDPDDATKTIEGYPAPLRAVFVAEAPGGKPNSR